MLRFVGVAVAGIRTVSLPELSLSFGTTRLTSTGTLDVVCSGVNVIGQRFGFSE